MLFGEEKNNRIKFCTVAGIQANETTSFLLTRIGLVKRKNDKLMYVVKSVIKIRYFIVCGKI